MKKLVFIFFLLFITTYGIGQKQGNIWYFGDRAGLDFNSGTPVALTDGQTYLVDNHNEGTSVICDSAGALLFYSNGEQIWNRNHVTMLNGNNLLGHLSSTHAAFIVPLPGSEQLFYLFTTDAFYSHDLVYGFRYSIIDMCLDNGLGGVIPGEKNMLLLDTVAEKIAVVQHTNGSDYWIITHKYWSDAFYAFLLTNNGISDTVITHIGSIHEHPLSPVNTSVAIGQMKASPDGSKLALCASNRTPPLTELFDFDDNTGVVSNVISLPADTFGAEYGVAFSPDNSKLYFSTSGTWSIYQYDLTAGGGNPDSIKASKVVIVTLVNGPSICALQLAPDNKIYGVIYDATYVCAINNPNAPGLACDFVENAVGLNGKKSNMGLPNFIAGYKYSNGLLPEDQEIYVSIGNDTTICDTVSLTLNAGNMGEEYIWSTGDTSQIITVSDPGEYFIEVKKQGCIGTASAMDTINIGVEDCEETPEPCTLFIPNVFSPNGDNKNDRLFVRGNKINIIKFIIYDRWGEKVFEASDINQGWDGVSNGKKLNPAVFVYYLEATCPDGKSIIKKENVTLVR